MLLPVENKIYMRIAGVMLLMSLFLLACGEDNDEYCAKAEYAKVIELEVTDKICFPDGNTLTFTSIEHQLCPCGSYCGWAGDLYITFTTSTGPKSFYQGGATQLENIFDGFEITSLFYLYGQEEEEVPECAEDFEPNKIKLFFTIAKS